MKMILEYDFDSSHHLTAGVPEKHKCRRFHGHTYRMEVILSGPVDADGMLVEYGVADRSILPVVALVDHHDLNTLNQRCSTEAAILVAANPTSERLIDWFAIRLGLLSSLKTGVSLHEITLHESSRSAVRWP